MDEADVPFYLHRVALHPTDATIDPEVHADEGGMLTGFVPLEVVTRGGATVRRYINGAEHRGSISLAVDLDAIDSVQTIAIPSLCARRPRDLRCDCSRSAMHRRARRRP
ncbi:MAG: hypothetical protein INR66_18480 [Gordonia polyisoprenivorans]|nr:hypothetical protein [Gordonia polyisoprenivorans]